jgi:hypothetical protein
MQTQSATIDNERPPFVQFEMREKEDRTASIAAGHYVAQDVEMAIIARPGSRDTLEKEAESWLSEMRTKSRKGEIPPGWYDFFQRRYTEWKNGETGSVTTGTPIRGWPVLGPAAQKTLIAAGIMTVEDLSEVSDSDLQNIGTGAMSFKQKAKLFLEAANGPGKMAERVNAMEVQMKEMADLIKRQAEALKAAEAQNPKPDSGKKAF